MIQAASHKIIGTGLAKLIGAGVVIVIVSFYVISNGLIL
jgi:hypothetical protein